MDDCLSTLSLFAAMPTHRLFKIDPLRLKISKTLIDMLKLYLIETKGLEKVFFSTNGVYYQAKL